MKKNIFILGNFGYQLNNLNGQTMRTRTIYETLNKFLCKEKYAIKFTDTSFSSNIIKILWNYIKGFIYWTTSSTVILLPAQKAIKYVLPIFYYLNFFLRKNIHLIAIGGWLPEFLDNKKRYKKYLKNVKFIYVQTESLKSRLEDQGLDNIVYFPNFRTYKNKNIQMVNVEKVCRLVFFSRVIKEKGIELAINSVKKVNEGLGEGIELHIFGPVGENYKKKFKSLIKGFPFIHYKGVLEPDEILLVLSHYDIMIFPTYYKGEGFPGALLDALTAGIPVIASDWKYNSEVIRDGFTGFLFNNNDVEDLIEKIKIFIHNPSLINQMKKNSILESEKYKESNVAPILLNRLDL